MKAYSLFPTLICEEFYDDKENFKQIFLENAFQHITNGESGELSGNVDVHLNPAFQNFFEFVAQNAKQFVSVLEIDPEIFHFSIVKTWLNITRESDNPAHDHSDSHLSFTYYVNVPEDIHKNFVVYCPHEINSLYYGMLQFNVREYNQFNSANHQLLTEEGKLLLFPSRLRHSVTSVDHLNPILKPETKVETVEQLKNKRISIAGDFILTHKNKTSQFLGLQPIKNWKTY
jgi:uncharacterized protein (TIGR02466 family)